MEPRSRFYGRQPAAWLAALCLLLTPLASWAAAATVPAAPAAAPERIQGPDGTSFDTLDQLMEYYREMAPPAPLDNGPGIGDMTTPLPQVSAVLTARVMPGSQFNLPPGWERKFTWAGRQLVLWGRAAGGSGSYTATWDPGDGSGPQAANVSNPNYIYLQHTYASFGPMLATLQVTDTGTSEVVSATVRIVVDVAPPAHDTRVEAAIEDGLRRLYLQQAVNGTWTGYGGLGTSTGLALSAFELAGHKPGNDPATDVYVDRVELGLEAMIDRLTTQTLTVQTAGNPDFALVNGLGVRHTDGTGAYSQGIIMLALGLSSSPTRVHHGVSLDNWTYWNILADMVDQLAWSQTDAGGQRGGWRYYVSQASYGSDNSAVQWASIGLAAAEVKPWEISAAPFVKTELEIWLNYSQLGDGGFGYTGPDQSNCARTGSGIYSHYYIRTSETSDPRVQAALAWLTTNWCCDTFNGNLYAMYAVKKALADYGITQIGGHDWEVEFERYLVKGLTTPCGSDSYHQQTDTGNPLTDGYWFDGYLFSYYYNDATAFALLILIPGVHCPAGTPNAEPVATPSAACPGAVTCYELDGRGSTPANQTSEIQQWLWDYFDDGTIDASGPVVCAPADSFPLPPGETSHEYRVCLTVIDNSDSLAICNSNTQCFTITVGTDNNPPVPVTGGPYTACVGDTIWLKGCASYDPDAECIGDSICEYQWDLDANGTYEYVTTTCPPDTSLIFFTEVEREIQLRVKDCNGLLSEPGLGIIRVWSSYRELSIAAEDIQFTRFGCDSLRITGIVHASTREPGLVIPAAAVAVFFDDPTCTIPANRICSRTTPALMDGGTFSFTCTWPLPDENPHDIFVCVDPAQQVLECVETDNVASRHFECPSGEMIALNDVLQTEGVDELLRIPDPSTGVCELVGSLGNHFLEAEALAVEPTTGRIFVVDDARLLILDGTTGNGTEIGPIGFSDVDGIAFQPQTGILYGVTYGSNKIIRIDTATGAGTEVADEVLVGYHMNDLTFHPDGRAFILVDGTPRVFLVDILTGAKLYKWTLTGATSLEALVWDPEGITLYSAADRGDFKDLVTIDLATSAVTFVSDLHSGYRDIEGLAFTVGARTRIAQSWGTLVSVGPPSRREFRLYQNVPNPFNPSTRIGFDLPEAATIELSVFDVAGRKITTLAHGSWSAGHHEVMWDGRSSSGSPVAAGIYYYVLRDRTSGQTQRMVLVK